MAISVGVHTHVTNPLSSGYLCYLACIKSWAKVADEVVVVDGGTTDASLGTLHDWLGPLRGKVRIIAPPEAHWGDGDLWEWPQIAMNRQVGFEALTTDWAIHVDADHVCPEVHGAALRRELSQHSEAMLLSMPIRFYDNGNFLDRKFPRSWVVNLKKVREENQAIAYGMDRVSGSGLDYPIHIKSKQIFRDPDTGYAKEFFWGEHVQSQGLVLLRPFSMGHFYFTQQQCLAKNLRLSRVCGRFRGVGSNTRFEVAHVLRYHRIIGQERVRELLRKPFEREAAELLSAFYKEEMLGGALYCAPRAWVEKLRDVWCQALRAQRILWSKLRCAPCLMNMPERWQS